MDSPQNSLLKDQVSWQPDDGQDLSLKDLVHLFKIDVGRHAGRTDDLREYLSAAELNKAGRYLTQQDRENFLVRKHFLRLILSRFCGISPAQIDYHQSGNKKPAVHGLHFNVSHTMNAVVIAVSNTDVGTDIEYIKPDFEFADVMELCFNAEESSFVTNGKDQTLNFFTLWTRKEALLKATGEGLVDDLRQVSALPEYVSRNAKEFHLESLATDDHYLISTAAVNRKMMLWEYAG